MTELEKFQQEYSEAVERERFMRDAAFLAPALPEKVAGLAAGPLTMQHVLVLRTSGNAFLSGGIPDEDDAFALLWAVSPLYSLHRRRKQKMLRACKAFMPPFRRPWEGLKHYQGRAIKCFERFMEVSKELYAYLDDAFMDEPPHSGDGGSKSYYSDAAALVDEFGSEYGWSIEQTLNTPLKISFQLLKRIRERARLKSKFPPAMFNPSDAILGRMLKAETDEWMTKQQN